MTGPVLETKRLVKRFGGFTATDDVDFALMPGEIHALIGPNGAGKTTLVKQLSGELVPDSGKITLGGEDVTGLSVDKRALRGIGRSFQVTSVLNSFSAVENVMLAVQAHRPGRYDPWARFGRNYEMREQAMTALALVGLAAKADCGADELGYGELRQLELAMVLSEPPKALLLDEPMAGMGSGESKEVVGLIRSLRGRYAILLVEHDMQAVFALADRITVLVYGRVLATGTPDAVRANREVRESYLGRDA